MTFQKEKAQVRAVARLIAFGFSEEDALSTYHIKDADLVASWKQTMKGAMFKGVVREFQEEIEQRMLDEHFEDSAVAKLWATRGDAADTLCREVTNYDKENQGATASSRITAAKTILDKTGSQEEDKAKPVYIPTLTEETMKSIFERESPSSTQCCRTNI